MTLDPDLLLVLAGAFGLLVAASIISEFLRRTYSPEGESATIENLHARVLSWWGMVLLLGLSLLFGRAGVTVLFALCSFAALREFLTLLRTDRADHWVLVASFFMVLPFQYWLVAIDWYGLYAIYIPVYVFLLMPILAALRGQTSAFLVRVAEIQWALMIAVYCVSHVPALLFLEIPGFEGRNVLLIAWLVVVVQGSDVLQYVFGKLFGRHKVAPNLSPSKTWEGMIGGTLAAAALGAGLWWITPFSPLHAFLLAVVVTVMGFFGGLVMSAIKRDRGVKDWGQSIAGHGGFIDRLDSVMFAAPIFFHLVRFSWSLT
jgi:phosphatidate cytidylyltransferase